MCIGALDRTGFNVNTGGMERNTEGMKSHMRVAELHTEQDWVQYMRCRQKRLRQLEREASGSNMAYPEDKTYE